MKKSTIQDLFPLIDKWDREKTAFAVCQKEASDIIRDVDFGKRERDRTTILNNINNTNPDPADNNIHSRDELIKYLQNSMLKYLGLGMGRGRI